MGIRLTSGRRPSRGASRVSRLGPAIPVPEKVAEKTVQDSFQWDAKFGAGQDVFDALVRQVDKLDASYRT